jgi:hypothetical protein
LVQRDISLLNRLSPKTLFETLCVHLTLCLSV